MNTRKIIFTLSFIAGLFCAASSLAAEATLGPVGYWQTIDLDKVPRSIVKISSNGDELSATIVKVIANKGHTDADVCSKCTGEFKDKPVVGLRFIWGVKKAADNEKWTNGNLIDTDSGSTYHCNISTSADGKILYLHAYLGVPFLGKTIEWQRVPEVEIED